MGSQMMGNDLTMQQQQMQAEGSLPGTPPPPGPPMPPGGVQGMSMPMMGVDTGVMGGRPMAPPDPLAGGG